MKSEYNLTTRMVMPLLGWDLAIFKPYIHNAYMRHKEIDRFRTGHVFVLLRWSSADRYNKLIDVITDSKFHVSNYDLDTEGTYVMHVFRIPEQMKKDYDLIMEGQYSKISKFALNLILQSNKAGDEVDHILRRDDELRQKIEDELDIDLPKTAEVYSRFDDEEVLKREEFSKEKLQELLILN